VARTYERALRHLSRRGLPKRPSETPHEFASRVAANNVEGSEVLARLTDLYAGARFGKRAVDQDRLRELAERLPDLGRSPRPADESTDAIRGAT
jgi:hypothetical protein